MMKFEILRNVGEPQYHSSQILAKKQKIENLAQTQPSGNDYTGEQKNKSNDQVIGTQYIFLFFRNYKKLCQTTR